MIKITHNNRCSKSRGAMDLLRRSGLSFETVSYLEGALKAEELEVILDKLSVSAEALVRKGETLFKEKFRDASVGFSERDWLDMLVENPSLLERPIVFDEKGAVVGRPLENVEAFLRERL